MQVIKTQSISKEKEKKHNIKIIHGLEMIYTNIIK